MASDHFSSCYLLFAYSILYLLDFGLSRVRYCNIQFSQIRLSMKFAGFRLRAYSATYKYPIINMFSVCDNKFTNIDEISRRISQEILF
jgi:hypothetical protein